MQEENLYVTNHDFGYGKTSFFGQLNKLKLRSLYDLEVYVKEGIEDLFEAKIQNNVIDFIIDFLKYEIIFEIVK